MSPAADFISDLETKVAQQLKSQRVGYLLGAGSSYLNGAGYPLAFQLWNLIKDRISDTTKRDEIQAKLTNGASGLEHALDLLDDGGANDTPYRHLVTAALAELLMTKTPSLDLHSEFVRRVSQRADPCAKIFSLNYDPLIERAAAHARIRIVDGFLGSENSFFDPAVFEERVGRIRGTHKGKQFDETVKPLHLLKLHGSLGWYECPTNGIRRSRFDAGPPTSTKRLMIPPQRRKAVDTMTPPYSNLWSTFRGCLGHNATPINRLVCIGYAFVDEHVNSVIEAALARTDFTVLIFTKALETAAWARWSTKTNVIIVTETQCSLKGRTGPGHADLWSFERLAKEI
ncbi:MAG: SIR2 family protein [Elusimicrobiota bacterium]